MRGFHCENDFLLIYNSNGEPKWSFHTGKTWSKELMERLYTLY